MKQFANCYCENLTNILNDCLKENRFQIKQIIPVFKKLDNTSKDSYQPKSTSSNFAKFFERIIYSQLNDRKENSLNISLLFVKSRNTKLLLKNDRILEAQVKYR